MKFIKGARTWRSILGTQTFFWPLTHPPSPPPPRYSINQPLSKGLVWYHATPGRCVGVYGAVYTPGTVLECSLWKETWSIQCSCGPHASLKWAPTEV